MYTTVKYIDKLFKIVIIVAYDTGVLVMNMLYYNKYFRNMPNRNVM